ncbi:glycoside hydrolase family 3 protein [Promineifilum sp.]|uniref:glycoside hydrolase family 3 protein n=1 Tax=Promineifilum sp. TaxID=2664178 RepID=UPI0035AECBA3
MSQPPIDFIGDKLMLAFEGRQPPGRILDWIATRGVAGFTLFREHNYDDPAQFRALTDALQAAARAAGHPPLLIAVDQEGGQLTALGAGLTQFAGNMALGAAGDPALARRVGRAMGRELAAVGANVNYGPVLDLATNPNNPSLGIRAFSDDPALAGALGAALVDGLQASGVAATLKHFPGKGEAAVDSHFGLPVIAHDRARLERVEFAPFRAGVAAGAKLLMTGHFALPALTGTTAYPATVARAVMTDFARGDMGFQGVIITDALDMGAITQGAGQIIDVIAAVRAGVDLMLIMLDADTQERLYAGLALARSRELIDDSHLHASVGRIRALREWAAAQPQPGLDVVNCAEHRALEAELARRALTLVRDEAGLLPLRLPADARVAAVMPQPANLTPADTSAFVVPALADALRAYHPRVDEFVTAHRPDDAEIAALRERVSGYDLLVLGTINAFAQPQQAALAHELLATGVPAVTVSLRLPHDAAVYPARTHLATYSLHRPSLDALAGALFGDFAPTGRLPVKM